MAPMKLYGATVSWNVTRCVVALEEAGAEYQIVPIDFATAEHKSPDHLARNVRRRIVLSFYLHGRPVVVSPGGLHPLLLLLRDLI